MRYFSLIAFAILLASAAYAQLPMTGAGSVAGGGGPPPAACGTGVINLTTGCTQPMLGGL